ncbi:MAG TPA: BrxA/BrxB family bacilliredoxin [Bryobacteraceae bacterium]|nr:BrxA/BrxB family bacilliredoxin [Bryobacteraceae bacterium]
MRYPEQFVIPMRRDLTQYGVTEARTPEEVDAVLSQGSVLMIVNSVCGCAAGKARPAVGMALQHRVRPEKAATVFAGADMEALAHLREGKLAAVPPSSPSMALFVNGEPVFILHRRDIEMREAPQIAELLVQAFEKHCAPVAG